VQCRDTVVIEAGQVRLALGTPERAELASESDVLLTPPMPLRKIRDEALATIERKAIADALRFTRGNKAAAARLLEVDVKTLYAKLRLYDLGSLDN